MDAVLQSSKTRESAMATVPADVDLVEYYYERGFSDGLPVVPPTQEKVDEIVARLGGDASFVEARIAPRWGDLTREVLAINMVMAGCKPEYTPVVLAAVKALTDQAFNLNGVQATTHVASPLLIVNGPIAREIGMNGGVNAFGSGNRANATIGRALRLIMLNVGGGWPGDLDKSTLGHPGKYTYCVTENEAQSPLAPYHVEHGYKPEDSTVFVMAAEAPHSVTNHISNDPEGILDTMCSAMSTIASNSAVLGGHVAVVLGLEHAQTIGKHGWSRADVRNYLFQNHGNRFIDLAYGHRYGKVYNRNLPRYYKREDNTRIPIIHSPENIHLFVMGGEAGRFSVLIPGWGHMSSPVLRAVEGSGAGDNGAECVGGACAL
ncbi:hypothetical protein AWB69_02037 [Caballeronia udeis]|uniref:Thiol-disulfide oxidoreductase domain-containing protein n=1 Tax=Caballeronia udeis TaxID=1232866 RepID=A0A158G5R7_9BURK|nr:hypothetical protein [Caballeronia udeis]SAL26969.1 hypothetical protein AWB69_02037 [Caballeronia udeis]